MKLNFTIDKKFLIVATLRGMKNTSFSSQKYKKDIVKFQNYAWKESQRFYDFFVGRQRFRPQELKEDNLQLFVKDSFGYLKKLSRSKEFKKIYSQTEEYLKFCEKQWHKNYKKAEQTIKDLTGFKLDKEITVYITHPSLKNGWNMGSNEISFGHNEDWSNYATIYLWHEILHSYFESSHFNHAVIELITDNELNNRLNGYKYPPLKGHKKLNDIEKKLLPLWKKYLQGGGNNILEFHKDIKLK